MSSPLLIARTLDNALYLLPAMANRHGLITGATGTGKTVTLQKLAESFSEIGVPVFMADVKGDLTGIAAAGQSSEKLQARLEKIGVSDWEPHANPVVLWDIFGEKGHPVRATVSDLGPLLLARLLNLNEVQSGVLNIIFRIADDRGLLLLDFKDLRAITQFIGDNAKSFQNQYGNINSASIGAIQRGLLTLEQQGAEHFFGEPMLDIADWMRVDASGKGVINILSAEKLYQMPKLYAASLLWMLSELYERLPEAGDLDKPKLVFFFDEAHLLFNDAPQVLLDKIEQVIPPYPLQGRRRLLCLAEPGGYSRRRARPAGQPRAACPARLYAEGPEGGENRRPDHARQPGLQYRAGDPGAGHRRGADLLPR